ncbi:ATP-binding protein [Streptomyces sp. H27-D2]|uniref:ATP-binding protein n=1 Tax=Streptomyces sp. H27-D2 TaxID=3046304 RepID=UPI002DBBE74A|nr:ATP-binding protein [Streptomyces sp. H27-D2]MEC4017686.1 ATP-binding protein [Streptomyces sp. H27-D2]
MREDVLDYTPYPKSVRLARHRTARPVVEWGHPELAGDAALLLSELATNAVLHGCVPGRLFRVRTTLHAAVLRIAVSDPRGESLPRPRAAGPDDKFGRGLLIVRTLAARWGVRERTVGKTVWCELDRTPAPASVAPPPRR